VKTTIDLPDELMRAVKLRALEENRKLKDTVADLLRRGLSQEAAPVPAVSRRVRLPLVQCANDASQSDEVTPERAAEVLLEEEAEALREAVR
jgi:hypothetical protein